MKVETKARLLALAAKWRGEAEEYNMKFRDTDPHGAQVCVAALEGCADELERACSQ